MSWEELQTNLWKKEESAWRNLNKDMAPKIC